MIGIQPIADAIKAEKEIFFFLPIITFAIIANTDLQLLDQGDIGGQKVTQDESNINPISSGAI